MTVETCNDALRRLATTPPDGAFSPHYVDEVRRVAKWALDCLVAAEEALRQANAGRCQICGAPTPCHCNEPDGIP